MKKQLVIAAAAVMLSAGMVAGAENTEVQAASKKISINKKNFPDSVFRELVRVNYDKNKDKKLSKTEIKRAKKFGSSSCKNSVKIKSSQYAKYKRKYVKDIKNFKGIEKLTNLQKMVASGTSVKTINLKKNKNLTYLEMTDGKLQKLDLNSNKKLKYVYLQYNQLTSLKMNKCKKLLSVNLTGHMVKKLKIDRNKSTKVVGETYYAPFSSTSVKSTFGENDGGNLDVNGNYCVYEWSEDYSSCVKKTWNKTALETATVNLGTVAVAKAKAVQKITAQWHDGAGNFYFVADKDGNMVEKTINYLYKVNPQGALEKEILLNDQMIFSEEYFNRCSLSYMNQKNGVVALRLTSAGYKNGVLFFDMNTMKVTKQVDCTFVPLAIEGDVVAGCEEDEIVVSKIVAGTKKQLGEADENKGELEVVSLSSSHRMTIPKRYNYSAYSIAIKNNYLYLISGDGFYKAKLSANSFKQLYGVGKISGMQDTNTFYTMTMSNEKEIYLMTSKENEGVVQYSLQVCKVS
ncbi:MAG: hypothetical protein J5988_14475 [Eubacterium sp.]|nr:hypothetical protein [Eubacterium sp.]